MKRIGRRLFLSLTAAGMGMARLARAQNGKRVIVVGASGGTGRLIIAMLKEQGYTVLPTSRNPDRAAETVEGDYTWLPMDITDRDSVEAAVKDVDFIITSYGATEREGPNDPEQVEWIGGRYLIDAAKAAGVRHYVMISSASAGNPDSPLNRMFGNVLVWKGQAEDYLRQSGLPYTIVRGPGLLDEPGGEKPVVLESGGSGRRRLTRADLATVTVTTLNNVAALGKTFIAKNSDGESAPDLPEQLRALPLD